MNDKFKTINQDIINPLYEKIRFNDRTIGNHIEISHGSIKEDKIDHAVLNLILLENASGRYEEAKAISEQDNQYKIFKNMLNISRQKVMEYTGETHEL